MEIDIDGLTFFSNFDSGNLANVEKCRGNSNSDNVCEFNVWTSPDCANTPYEKDYSSWFYFGIRGNVPNKKLQINVVNMNKQVRLYSQGMAPLVKSIPEQSFWKRISNPVNYKVENGRFILSFQYQLPDHAESVTYFAFCYPYSYSKCQERLNCLERQFHISDNPCGLKSDTIYFYRELLCYSIEKLRVDLVTVTSCHGVLEDRECPLKELFPEGNKPRCHKFEGKKVFFVSSRVHPGETPSSFVFDGFLNFILRQDDPRAIALRKYFVFKLIPMLNPDGVKQGHYRTDTRGTNLNRVYLNPDYRIHPSIFAARTLLEYYHFEYAVSSHGKLTTIPLYQYNQGSPLAGNKLDSRLKQHANSSRKLDFDKVRGLKVIAPSDDGVAFYVDLHGHASKRGCFIYGNALEAAEDRIKILLFAKLMSFNCTHFEFDSCNFSERNMRARDKKDGLSKEGSGRVAIHKILGITHSYTLECNYNGGRIVNNVPSASSDNEGADLAMPLNTTLQYTCLHYEEIGQAVAISALDIINANPLSRIEKSEFRNMNGVIRWITNYEKHNSRHLRQKKSRWLRAE
ncbi:uncharacterized protein TRIADDRAFT_19682 [Trichoplax adhaerens]|uniref:Cytosolic carboxypeptidase-like protein 5 n=1 Tax=Trichoplax adhaerens TaxID=10228 RepID=B3RIC7_TRIAD|nr:hypothetical protein TRIADDRAFT_19682 [Trichoplax adhaerens]EDV28996.1 hypothetical protein TRIADDRAFT_19682 [Trichoplax adhaerens]|eukprot:XP_002108198.1 hypothetical protein TRIADDRAFT_19682 [Trichoplax adhaerens]